MEEVLKLREYYDHKSHPYDYEPTVIQKPEEIDGVSCYWFIPENPSPKKIVLFLHGGGFAMGSIQTHGRMVSHFAKALETQILFVEYALAPEHPFPAGLNDILTVYQHILRHNSGFQIDLIGDSAGGSLIVSAVGAMLKTGLPLPHAVVLISAWINFDCDTPSYTESTSIDISLTKEMLQMLGVAYTGHIPLEVSNPGNITFSEFPPVLIMVGTNEIILDDSKRFYEAIRRIQPKSKLSIYEDQPHVWLKKNVLKDASRQALAEMAEFIGA